MGGKQSTAGRPRGAFPGVSSDDSAVPPSAHFGHYRPSGTTMGLRSRSVSSVAGMGIDHSPAVPFGFYTPRGTDSDRAGGGSGGTTAAPHGTGYQDGVGGGHHTDGVLYLGSRGSLADTLPLHIAPRWFSAHSDDVLARDAGECVICLEELQQGDTIARLPCLCIYHKSCIDSWFEINRSCPEHPSD
ncbi:E3 ubiquitin-protein ligase znrf1 isoform X2 [Austrofundulus limnaeus]|uniref:E3 ubiquitin-protein ligase ZNRF1 n=1 Tax=Austrofundulus limnaeus TaxID=52670 RepID=A0A2I4D9I0_AUSLI|nr:PREDICTED: E3 ubiquitin-protein ligase ZNRF1 isoform X2 [Austrofundulus limnaeus]